jgi:hypothetical protein
MEEVIAAAERYYQTQPRPTQPLASSGNAAPSHLMALVGNRHATHPFGATKPAGVAAAAGTMPAAPPVPSNPMLSDEQLMAMAARLLSLPIAIKIAGANQALSAMSEWEQVAAASGAGFSTREPPAPSVVFLPGCTQCRGTVSDNVAARQCQQSGSAIKLQSRRPNRH